MNPTPSNPNQIITTYSTDLNPNQLYIKIEDTWQIAKLGVKAIREIITDVSFNKEEFNSYFDTKILKERKLEEEIIKQFNQVGIIITRESNE